MADAILNEAEAVGGVSQDVLQRSDLLVMVVPSPAVAESRIRERHERSSAV